MSSKLKSFDLTAAGVGTTGIIDFNQFTKFQANDLTKKAHIWLFNESGCGLDVVFLASNNSHYLPAGGWGTFDLEPNDGSVKATVAYVLPNPPVSSLNAIYYAPGEQIPQSYTLGNSPIGGGVTSGVGNTLSNEGAGAGTEIIDIGTATTAKLIDIFNDHFKWSIEQSLVAHQVLKGQAAGNPLQLGQLGDIVEVLGSLQVDTSQLIQATPLSQNGTTSGTFSMWQPWTGTVKLLILQQVNYQNSAADPGPLILPSAFTNGGIGLSTNIGGWTVKNGASVISTDNATSFGAGSSSNPTPSWTWYAINSAFDRLQPNLSNGTAHNAWGFILGI